MKKFEKPIMKVTNFDKEDILTISSAKGREYVSDNVYTQEVSEYTLTWN